MAKKPRDIGASVRARLLNLSRDRAQPFDLLLTRYALERLLYRLSVSAHRDRFVLKGALLVTTWFDNRHRPTHGGLRLMTTATIVSARLRVVVDIGFGDIGGPSRIPSHCETR